jgi:hypothetical protein
MVLPYAMVLPFQALLAAAFPRRLQALFRPAEEAGTSKPAADLGVSFINVAQESGVNAKTIFGGEHKNKYLLETTGCGVAFYDYDNDGWLDIFLVNGSRLEGFPPGKEPTSHLFKNNRDGTFTDVTVKAGLAHSGWGQGVCIGDYDNDGFDDLFVTYYGKNVLYHNNGDGTFTDVSAEMGIAGQVGKGMGVAIADYDGDGWMDIFVANDNERNFLFRNVGGKRFDEVGVESSVAYAEDGVPVSSMGVDFRDWSNDGKPSLFVTALGGETFPLFRNEGNNLFQVETYQAKIGFPSFRMSGWGAGIYDLDNDGYKDLFSANSHVSENADIDSQQHYRQPNAIFQNLRNGIFADVGAHSGPDLSAAAAHRGCAFGDLNNDGKIDIVVSAIGSTAELLYNTSPAHNHWLLVQTIGTKSNRDGIGTQIKVTGKSGLVQYNQVTTAGSYASSSDKRVHFGLGSDSLVKEIELRWPSGTRQVLHNVKTDQILKVTEGR